MLPAGTSMVRAVLSFTMMVLTVVVPAPTVTFPVEPLVTRTLLLAPLAIVGPAPDSVVQFV